VIDRPGEAQLAEFRRVVDRLAGEGAEAGDACEGDEVPFARRDQVRQRRCRRVERALEVDVDHPLEALRIELEERPIGADARVCDDDVEAAKALNYGVGSGGDRDAMADVAGQAERTLER
jgi:hypothetical protein